MTQLPVSSVDFDVRDVDTQKDDLVTQFMTMAVVAHGSMAKSAPSSSPMTMYRKHKDTVLNSPIMNWIWSFLVSYRNSPSMKIKFIVCHILQGQR